MKWTCYSTLALIGGLLPLQIQAAEHPARLEVSAEQRSDLSLTLYTQDLGLVREKRQLPVLQSGQSVLIEDVSARLQPETLRLKNAGQIIEQNHNTDLLSYSRLLEHHIGKRVQLSLNHPTSGEQQVTTVRLLSINDSHALVEHENQIESIPLQGSYRFIFPSRPDNLTLHPGISFRSKGTSAANTAEISYLTSGLSWQMDYVMELNKAGNRASLDGMATLRNHTGTHFPAARISLLAGSVNQPARRVMERKVEHAMMAASSVAADAAPSRQQLQDFHLYSLPDPVDLKNNQQKQVSLLSATNFAVQRIHQLSLSVYAHPQPERRQLNPNLQLKFSNSKANGLGEPIPAGNIRVFSPDSSNQLQFIGGSTLSNLAENSEATVQLGQAFDVTVDQQQTGFEKTYNSVTVDQTITVRNSGEQPAQLELNTRFNRRWEIISSSQGYTPAGNAAHWQLSLPAGSETTLTFQVRQFNK